MHWGCHWFCLPEDVQLVPGQLGKRSAFPKAATGCCSVGVSAPLTHRRPLPFFRYSKRLCWDLLGPHLWEKQQKLGSSH